MTPNNDLDIEKMSESLLKLAFNQQKKALPLLQEMYCLFTMPEHERYRPYLRLVMRWLVVPYSFWPRDFVGIGKYLVEQVRSGASLSPRFILLMKFLRGFPPEAAQILVAMHEHAVQRGEYQAWIRCNKRYLAYEKRIRNSAKLRAEWEEIKREFNVDEYRNPAGIIRRDICCERNFKTDDFKFNWADDEAQFIQVFTAFCADWDLWGMEGDEPLLLKLSVNMTPYGLQIMLPKYLGADAKNEIVWREVSRIQKALGAACRGAKRIEAEEERHLEYLQVEEADQRATAFGYVGKERFDYIIRECRLAPNTSDRSIRYRIEQARRIREEAEKAG